MAPIATTYSRVDPRARGGDRTTSGRYIVQGGRSPRTRGRPTRPIARLKAPGSIPAHAGETWSADLAPPIRGVDPRARGGDEYRFLEDERVYGRSPRTRGRLVTEGCYSDYRRSIPAHAGETKK